MDDFYYDPNMFISKDYVRKQFSFGCINQDMLCSAAATTDFDLTGQIIWPASQVMAWFLISKGAEWISRARILEVGAGCGLVGFIAAHLGAQLVICSDGSHVVLDLLEQNKAAEWNSDLRSVEVESLTWGDQESIEKLVRKFAGRIPNVVLGADVFQTSFGSPRLLFQTVRAMFTEWRQQSEMACTSDSTDTDAVRWNFHFYTTFAIRKTTNEEEILECAEEEGFESNNIDFASFLPKGTAPGSFSMETIKLFRFTPR